MEGPAGRAGVAVEPTVAGFRLEHDHAHAVSDDVVELSCDQRTLLGHGIALGLVALALPPCRPSLPFDGPESRISTDDPDDPGGEQTREVNDGPHRAFNVMAQRVAS